MGDMINASLKDGLFRAVLRIVVYGCAAFYMLASDINNGFDAGFTFSRANTYSLAQFLLLVTIFELGMLVTFIKQKALYLTVLVCMAIVGMWFLREATMIEVQKKDADAIAAKACH